MLYAKDTHCKHMLIGSCNDTGYIPSLNELKSFKNGPRISLIKHHRSGTEYRDLPFRVVSLDGVFRGADLTSRSIKRSRSPDLTTSIPRIQSTAQPYFKVQLNRYGERIDIPLPHVERTCLRAVSQRQKSDLPGLCITHYVFGPGSCTGRCKYSHDDHIESTEVLALAFQARDTACREGELNPITLG